ncbi:hypothetical protein RND81_13G108100 [Saponaria officinalis]|uniref:Uncharacterized protein n=1 Tax=Saponaria officinalis TaxID=3572 RepID=A0AAW1H1T5_SAPOF
MHYHSFLFSVMCKCSYIVNEGGTTTTTNRKSRNKVLPSPSDSSSQATNPVSSPSPSASRRRVSTTFLSSPRSTSSPRLEPRWVATRDEHPRMFLPQIKRGKLKRRVTIGSNQSTSSGSGDVDEPDWPPFADEDYIVFCFEEDGAFHVVEDSPKTVPTKFQCEYHGNVSCACTDDSNVTNLSLTSRRDCLLPSQEGDEEEQMSPKLQTDETNKDGVDLLEMDKEVVRKESTESIECINGSVESTDSSRVDWDEHLQVDFPTSPNNLLSPSDFRIDSLLPDTLFEEEIFLSPKSQLGLKMTISDLLKNGNDGSCSASDESDVKDDNQSDQLAEDDGEEACSESSKSSVSNQSNSCSSFEFPVLQWEWIDSPVTWPRPGRVHFRKQKSKPSCLKCCKF